MTNKVPILEFDEDPNAILSPETEGFAGGVPYPKMVVMCFFRDVIEGLLAQGELTHLEDLRSEIGKNPVYSYGKLGCPVMVLHPGVGAPLAAGFLEELIAVGVTNVMVCGGCGVLKKEIAAGHPVILTAAVRDEGTSYHYIPPSREASPHPLAVAALVKVLNETGLEYLQGKSWTTDAIYRETIGGRKIRLEEGCDVVEMEAAALFAVSQFRGIKLGQVVYGGDLVVPDGWDGRKWHKRVDDRRLMFELAVKAVLALSQMG
jgi:uridine phosphorylase